MKFPSCPACGLPKPLCSCSCPDAVYYPVERVRFDVRIEREISPAEEISDYEKSNLFIKAYLIGKP